MNFFMTFVVAGLIFATAVGLILLVCCLKSILYDSHQDQREEREKALLEIERRRVSRNGRNKDDQILVEVKSEDPPSIKETSRVPEIRKAVDFQVMRQSEKRSSLLGEQNRGYPGTSSGSRVTLSGIDSDSGTTNHDHVVQKSGESASVKKPQPAKRKRRGYGNREEEYDDAEMAKGVELELLTEVTDHIKIILKEYDEAIKKKVDRESKIRRDIVEAELKNFNAMGDLVQQQLRQLSLQKFMEFTDMSKEEARIFASIETNRNLRKQQDEKLDLIYDSKQRQVKETRKIASESATMEAARLVEIKEAENREAQIRLEKSLVEDEARRKKQEEQTKNKNKAIEANLKLEALRLLEQSSNCKEQSVPAALQGLILKEDCDKYTRCTDLIQQYENATKDIVASSVDPNIKKFYFGAGVCINTPLNVIANTEPRQLALKTTHFIDMIDGKSVYERSSSEPFCASAMPNGRMFVLRLLAFQIVKKAEQEILSEKNGFIPLATMGTSLCTKFPELATLLQAYFYKLCPFLVPFSFPRGDKSFQEYCLSLGYDLKGEESTLRNLLLGRMKGYCSLYAMMVQTIEKNGPYDVGDANLFFSIGGVWEILTKTMKLEPQADVTIVVIQTLLELLADRLQQAYGKQFIKVMNVLISVYLPKINHVSSGAAQGEVKRIQQFQRFLEKISGV